jgi:hypothetical protein
MPLRLVRTPPRPSLLGPGGGVLKRTHSIIKHCLCCKGPWKDARAFKRAQKEFDALNPEKGAQRRVIGSRIPLSPSQEAHLKQNFLSDDGSCQKLCKKHWHELAAVGNSVLTRLQYERRTETPGVSVVPLDGPHGLAPPPARGRPGRLKQDKSLTTHFHQWCLEHTQPDPTDADVWHLSCFVSKEVWALESFVNYLKEPATGYVNPHPAKEPCSKHIFKLLRKEHKPAIKKKPQTKDFCNQCSRWEREQESYSKHKGAMPGGVPEAERAATHAKQEKEWERHVRMAREAYRKYKEVSRDAREQYDKLLLDVNETVPTTLEERQQGGATKKLSIRGRPRRDLTIVCCWDAMMNRVYPKWNVGAQPNIEFYANRLQLFTMGVFNETVRHGRCFLWNTEGGPANGQKMWALMWEYFSDPAVRMDAKKLHLVFDNCSVNKNAKILAAAHTMVELGWFADVEVQFLITGHTKFSPDRMFAWMSTEYKRQDMFNLKDIVEKVRATSTAKVRYDAVDASDTVLISYDEYFEKYFRTMKGITGYHHFSFRCKTKRDASRYVIVKRLKCGKHRHRFHTCTKELRRGNYHERTRMIEPKTLPKKQLSDALRKDLGKLQLHTIERVDGVDDDGDDEVDEARFREDIEDAEMP